MFPHFRHERLKDPLDQEVCFPYPALLRLEDFSRWKIQLPPTYSSPGGFPQWTGSFDRLMWTLTLDFFPQEPCSVTFHDSIPKAYRSNSDFMKGEVCPLNSSQVVLETRVGITRGYKGMWAGLLSFRIEKEWLTREQKHSSRDVPANQYVFWFKECCGKMVSDVGVQKEISRP